MKGVLIRAEILSRFKTQSHSLMSRSLLSSAICSLPCMQGRAGLGWGCLCFSVQLTVAMTSDRKNHIAAASESCRSLRSHPSLALPCEHGRGPTLGIALALSVIELTAATIDQQIGRIDEARFITGQKQRGISDLFGRANTLAGKKLNLPATLGFGVRA